jgi:hypothetical protein
MERTIDLLKLIDPERDAVVGTWTIAKDGLVSDTTPKARLAIPYRPPEEYDFIIEVTMPGPQASVHQLLSKAAAAFEWSMLGPGRKGVRLADIRGHAVIGNPTWRSYNFEADKRYNREEVTRIVNQVLTQYNTQLRDERTQADADRQRELRQERDDLRNQLDGLGRRLISLRQESSIIATDERGSERLARLTALTHHLTDAQVELAQAKAAWDQFEKLREAAGEGKDMTPVLMAFPEMMESLRRDPSITSMNKQVSRLNLELAGMKLRSEEKNDDIRRLEAMDPARLTDDQSADVPVTYSVEARLDGPLLAPPRRGPRQGRPSVPQREVLPPLVGVRAVIDDVTGEVVLPTP